MSSPRSETEWIYMLHGTFVHTTSLSVGIGPGRAWQVRYHTCYRIGVSVIGGLVLTLLYLWELPVWPHGGMFAVLGRSSAGDCNRDPDAGCNRNSQVFVR